MKTRLTELLGIETPIVRGGMMRVGTADLAAAASNAGALGVMTALSQAPKWHIAHGWKSPTKYSINNAVMLELPEDDFEAIMSKNHSADVVDGRRLRSKRSRLAIIDAALALQEEGILVPTAQQISERAGIGIRSFFRHFEDMESLFEAADDHIRDSYEALFIGGDRGGTLAERIDHAVERHADAYESVRNMVLGTQAQLWRYEILRKNYARNQRGLRKDLDDWLPELKSVPRASREAVDAIASFEIWHRLRVHQKLSKKSSINTVKIMMKAVIDNASS